MRLAAFLSLAVAATATDVLSQDPFEQWHGPKGGDVRGPCPFLNTFANHGFLPRTGKYITQQNLADGLFNAVNFDANISAFLFDFAISTNPEPNSTWFSLDHLTRHNVLEHDASLSRIDAFHGHADIFNQEVFDESTSYWDDIINVKSGAAAVVARMKTCKSTNPTYSLSALGEAFILGEVAAFISILGDAETVTVEKPRVEYLFQNERLPTELGWKRPESPFTIDVLVRNLNLVGDEYRKLLNSTVNSTALRKRNEGYAARLRRGSAKLY
ncbi:Chloroperoxidase [Triangularia verruculosa]|uniref:Chloroperoxidase n=1 Tax=Triangularia verruculosa TaxID=2587418 RepID=A0AAN6XBD3_9PEZI|nr:Chloroperoxidase [Triangularia verruculosa]